MTAPLAPDLSDRVALYSVGALDAAGLTAAFATSTVYAVRPPGRPAVSAGRLADGDAVAVFSSLQALAAWCVSTGAAESLAGGVDWFACTGGDLLTVWPEHCDLVLDPGGPHSVSYPARSLRVDAVIGVRAGRALVSH